MIEQTPIPVIWFDVSSSRAPFAFLAVLALIGAGLDRRHWRWAGVAAAAAAIMAGCGTLALLVLARVNRPVQLPQFSPTDVREVTVVCPRCNRKRSIAVESGSCAVCGLGIGVRLVPA